MAGAIRLLGKYEGVFMDTLLCTGQRSDNHGLCNIADWSKSQRSLSSILTLLSRQAIGCGGRWDQLSLRPCSCHARRVNEQLHTVKSKGLPLRFVPQGSERPQRLRAISGSEYATCYSIVTYL